MTRLLVFVILILFLYYVLYYLIKDMSRRKRSPGESDPEELVQDPYCQTYIPRRSAVKRRIAGKEYYFCNQKCLEAFLQKER
jgi:uncharacterized protein